jgi:hypothetical protein
MKPNSFLFTALALIVLSAFCVLDYAVFSGVLSTLLWIGGFAFLSALFFFAYFVNGVYAWPWLFPACISAALSEIVFINIVGLIDERWAFAFGLASIVFPTLIGYMVNSPRRSKLPAITPVSI